jgi:hypothetical protein
VVYALLHIIWTSLSVDVLSNHPFLDAILTLDECASVDEVGRGVQHSRSLLFDKWSSKNGDFLKFAL